jgi:hypothetical protein
VGRTVPSFRLVLATEKAEWKTFRNALDKSERKEFDEMWDIPRLYVSACSNSVQLVPLHPIVISILFQHYKELKECISEVEEIEASRATAVSSDKNEQWLREKEVEEEEIKHATLDGYISEQHEVRPMFLCDRNILNLPAKRRGFSSSYDFKKP